MALRRLSKLLLLLSDFIVILHLKFKILAMHWTIIRWSAYMGQIIRLVIMTRGMGTLLLDSDVCSKKKIILYSTCDPLGLLN
jgi:hypothetical protein